MVGPFGLHPNKTMRSRALGLARPLVARGHEVTLFMPPWHTPQEADRTWQEDGVTLRYVPLRGGVAGITRRLLRETMTFRPHVVHCFKPKAYSGLVAWWLWYFHRRRLRLITDSDDWEGAGGWNEKAPYTAVQRRFFAWQEQWGLRHCHALTVASRALESISWSMGVPPQRVVYVPNGPGIAQPEAVDRAQKRDELGVGQRPLLLLYSRLFEFDINRLVTILAGVKAAVPDVAILSVGAGLYEADAAHLRQALVRHDLLAHVIDVGWVAEEELPALLATADVGIYLMEDTLLNRTKCPVKLADMISMGLPVVAEAVGQVPEYVVHRRSGLLRAAGDTEGLTQDLVLLMRDEALRRRLAAGARAHAAQHFTWETLAARVAQAYAVEA